MKHLLTILTFSLFSIQILAQGGQILSIYVEPENPTINDEVTVYAELVFNYSDCPLDYQAFALQNSTFVVTAHHCIGLLTAICSTTDTFELGPLPAGAYTFDLTLTSGGGGPNCSPGIVPDDNDQLQFMVSQSVGIDEVEDLEGFAYPNPVVDVLNLKRPLNISAVITNASGKRVVEIPAGTRQVDLSQLPNGIYVLHIGNSRLKLVKAD
ncbi:MAG: T9SS type A sorting domain-containing protein [Flavobacteriales bacterium]|nr:T9SS type A sorting domain-containing protein [Flavobacteriales bacterium]MCB9191814.1 T9SS type A sorting domain-containing protein [Flavobacteriales bacterium]